jgi:1,4-alpha-glucan branching enzyme
MLRKDWFVLPQGYLLLLLHAHLPFIRHPEHEDFLEERWFFEATLETYLPLLEMLENLHRDGVDFSLTLSFSPTLLTMFSDELLQQRLQRHLEKLLELTEKEIKRTKERPENALAHMYRERISGLYHYYLDRCRKNPLLVLQHLLSTGKVELITCAATHGFLPFMRREAAEAQIATAVSTFQQYFGQTPPGLWLPECAYYPGIENILDKYRLKYFFVDTHGLLYGNPAPCWGVYSPVQCPNGVAVFGRDPESSKQVWSKEEGYPGDFTYREYYRDIGWDLPLDYIRPYIHPDGIRLNTGIKYHRITGKTNDKELYDPWAAREKAALHAGNFMFNRQKQVEYLSSFMDRAPVIVAPYDAELFGHWWFEGPIWLEILLRKIHYDQETLKTITPSRYLSLYPESQVIQPSFSTWGDKGYYEFWLNGSNDWIYRHLHKAANYMVELATSLPNTEGILQRALQQAARELLLAQASDWAFIMTANTTINYARKRTQDHLGRFFKLYHDIKNNTLDPTWLQAIASKDNIFPEIDYGLYRQQNINDSRVVSHL